MFLIKHLPMLLIFQQNLCSGHPLLRFICSCSPLLGETDFLNDTMKFLSLFRLSALFPSLILKLEDSDQDISLRFLFWFNLYTFMPNNLVFGPVYVRVELIEEGKTKNHSVVSQSCDVKPLFSLLFS
jgi:hypothetical protein